MHEFKANWVKRNDSVNLVAENIVLDALKKSPRDRLADNYDTDRLAIRDHLLFDVLLDSHNSVVTFCGVFNGGRYPKNVYRVLNRTWVSSEYRVKGRHRCLATKHLLPGHLEILKDQNARFLFVSREGRFGHHFLKWWADNHACGGEWICPEGYYQTVPGVERKNAYQSIAFLRTEVEAEIPLKRISTVAWRALP